MNTWPTDIPINQDYNPSMLNWDYQGIKPFPKKQITIILDVSGSTFNLRSRGRMSSIISEQSLTKPIVISEMEASILVLYHLYKTYNLEGITLNYYVFSDSCLLTHQINNMQDPNIQLQEFANNLKQYTTPMQSNTNTKAALNQISEGGHLTNAFVIFATDGQPTDDTSDGLDCAKIVSNHKDSSWIVIGAGSIMSNTTNGICGYGICRNGQYSISDRTLLRGVSSECNTVFLASILEAADMAVYLPACRDRTTGEYDILGQAMDQFLGQLPLFSVLLDNSIVQYSDEISQILANNQALLDKINDKWYVITSQYQLAVCDQPNLSRLTVNKTDVLNNTYGAINSLASLVFDFGHYNLKAKTDGRYICVRSVIGN